MRFSRIALTILALPFAWQWGPALLDWLIRVSPPAIAGAFTFLTPDVSGRGLTFWFKFLIGLVLFWLIFQLLGLMLGFMAAKAQRFDTTKLLRRFQGICAELALLATLKNWRPSYTASRLIENRSITSGPAHIDWFWHHFGASLI